MTTAYLASHHDPMLVGISLLVATFASYVALDLMRRLHAAPVRHRSAWWAGGSIVMGTGIWAMHFVDMLGFDAGIPLGYQWGATLGSWLAAVASAGVALGVSTRERLNHGALAAVSAAMGAGISVMHYLGMQALDIVPGIVWQPWLVLASIAIAWLVSALALALFFGMRRLAHGARPGLQLLAALLMGGAIGGMHYTGMAAARLPQGAVCTTTGALTGEPLAVIVAVATLLLLAAALVVSIADTLAQTREARLAHSLDEATRTLQRRALEDGLTGLPNRALFNDRLEQAVARRSTDGPAEAAKTPLAVLLIDVDGFCAVNASFGQRAGDEVLLELSARLRATLGPGTTLARLGGDEFAALIEPCDGTPAALAQAARIRRALAEPFRPRNETISLACSIGIALFPQHDETGWRLLGRADAAMQAARRAGGDTVTVFRPDMEQDASEPLQLLHALRKALQRDELMLHYQPTVPTGHAGGHGMEALLRWRHPERGMISPAVFVPLAERFGLIDRLGHWVLEAACEQLAQWRAQGWRGHVAINLSPHQLLQADLAQRVAQALRARGLEPSSLVCEITETAMMENLPVQRGVLDELCAMGVCVSIDDFGTGYSSLAHLRNLPARQLKIDRSFVADLGVDPDANAVLESIVRMAHALRMEVVAEGVETPAQQTALTEMGCDLLQGYAIARPMPAEMAMRWWAEYRARYQAGSTCPEASAGEATASPA